MKKAISLAAPCIVIAALLAMISLTGCRFHLLQVLNAEGSYFDSNGVRIHYKIEGTGVPVILVHGLGVNTGINFGLRGVPQILSKTHQVITFDLRGHGRSDKPHETEDYGTEICEDIIRLMDHLEIEKAHVLGYSLGGFIVVKLAALHPDRLLSFAPCGAGWTPEPEKELRFFEELADDLEQGRGYGLLADRLTPIGEKESWTSRILINLGLSILNDETAMIAMLRSIPELLVEKESLRANPLPVLVVMGERDPLRIFAEHMAAITQNLQLVIVPDANHLSTLFKPETVDAIEAFLQYNSPGT